MSEHYLLDIPIYREAHQKFIQELEVAIEQRLSDVIDKQGLSRDRVPDSVMNIGDRIRAKMHSPWQFNQVVGWIRIYVLSGSVKGELWWTTETYVRRRPRKRRLEDIGKAFETSFLGSETNDQIVAEIRRHLASGLRGLRRGVVIDYSRFDNVAPYLCWRRLLFDAR